MRRLLKIGVMGGMGPETSAAFYKRIIQLFQTELGARHNFEFPEMVVHNVRAPDNVEAGVGNELLEHMLASMRLLAQTGMDFIAIPCNSAHVHIQAVQAASPIPVMDILEETAQVVQARGMKKVLVLGTRSTLGYNLYPPYLNRLGVAAIVPNEDEQAALTRIIMAVCDGSVGAATKREMLQVIQAYPQAEGVILGCTELPLVLTEAEIPIPTFDTLEILCQATFQRCLSSTKTQDARPKNGSREGEG